MCIYENWFCGNFWDPEHKKYQKFETAFAIVIPADEELLGWYWAAKEGQGEGPMVRLPEKSVVMIVENSLKMPKHGGGTKGRM